MFCLRLALRQLGPRSGRVLLCLREVFSQLLGVDGDLGLVSVEVGLNLGEHP